MTSSEQRTGFVSLVGRPNVGKSTMLNHMLGLKLSITSRKPQTTRHRLLGVLTRAESQILFIDTPGIHSLTKNTDHSLNRYMNQQATGALKDVDVCVLVVEAKGWQEADTAVLNFLQREHPNAICAINKIDRLKDKRRLLPLIAEIDQLYDFEAIVPISALRNEGLEELVDEISRFMPVGKHMYADDEITDRSTRFLVAELVREKLVRQLGDELPYRSTVATESYIDETDKIVIGAIILVEKDSQKGIVIGKGGQRLKSIGTAARESIEQLVDRPVQLHLTVKVQSNWTDSAELLVNLGYR